MKHNFRNLEIWRRSRILTTRIYKATSNFPKEEVYGITSQIRRCSISVPSNIAEGCGRSSFKELRYFLNIAIGSLCELESLLLVSKDLALLSQINSEELINETIEIRKMISGFRKTVQR